MSEPCSPTNSAAGVGRAKQSVWASAELARMPVSQTWDYVLRAPRGCCSRDARPPPPLSLLIWPIGPNPAIPPRRAQSHPILRAKRKLGRNRAEEQSLRPAPPLATLLSSQRTRPAKHRPLLAASRTQTPWVSLKTCNKGKLRQGDVCLSPWMVLSPCLLCSRDTVYDQISLRLHRLPFSLSPLQD